MLAGIHQPHYLPWQRYFEKIYRSDVFVLLDTAQFSKNGWQNRNKIKTAQGVGVLTVPVLASLEQPIAEIEIDNSKPWRKKHRASIEQSYGKAPFFREHAQFIRDAYTREWERLADLNRFMLDYYLAYLGIETPVVDASTLDVEGGATERLVNIVKAVGGDSYYSGAFALEAYLEPEKFDTAGITITLQNWEAPSYPQRHGEFQADLSIIDLIMNCGPRSLEILLSQCES